MLKVTTILLEILKQTASRLLYRDPDLIENTHRQHNTRLLRAEGLNKWGTVQWIESLGASVTHCGAVLCGTSEIKVRPHRTRSAAADCGLCPLRNVTF